MLEVKLRREDSGIAKIKFPKFEDLARRYIEEISVLKKCYNDERSKILQFIKETWAVYPINRILPHTINKWKDTALKTQSGGSVNRKLDVISSMYTTFKREWGYPVENPVLQIRRPKRAAPRDRRLSDEWVDGKMINTQRIYRLPEDVTGKKFEYVDTNFGKIIELLPSTQSIIAGVDRIIVNTITERLNQFRRKDDLN